MAINFLLGMAVGSAMISPSDIKPDLAGLPAICLTQSATNSYEAYYGCRWYSARQIKWVTTNKSCEESSWMCIDNFIKREWEMLQEINEQPTTKGE